MRRIACYKKFTTDPNALGTDIVRKYKNQVCIIAGEKIPGNAFRFVSDGPVITGPLVRQLCDDASLVHNADFAAHITGSHYAGTQIGRECSS